MEMLATIADAMRNWLRRGGEAPAEDLQVSVKLLRHLAGAESLWRPGLDVLRKRRDLKGPLLPGTDHRALHGERSVDHSAERLVQGMVQLDHLPRFQIHEVGDRQERSIQADLQRDAGFVQQG